MHMYVFSTLIYKLSSIIMTQYNHMHGCWHFEETSCLHLPPSSLKHHVPQNRWWPLTLLFSSPCTAVGCTVLALIESYCWCTLRNETVPSFNVFCASKKVYSIKDKLSYFLWFLGLFHMFLFGILQILGLEHSTLKILCEVCVRLIGPS